MMNSACAEIKFSDSSHWSTINDGTERGAASRSAVTPAPQGVVFSGTLGAIPGKEGLVGFAVARVPYQVQNSSSFNCFAVESESEINAEVILSVMDGEFPDGTRTYQLPFPLRIGLNKVKFHWSDFKAYKRGREDRTAPNLDSAKVTAFGIQVRRGAQPPLMRNDPAPIPFKIFIFN